MPDVLIPGLRVLNRRFRLTRQISTTQDCQTWEARDDDETPFLLKAWLTGSEPNQVLRAVWDRELRVLYRVSSSPSAEDCLLVVREAQFDTTFHPTICAFVLLAEGPGYDPLVTQIQKRGSCEWLKIAYTKKPDCRQLLWKGFKRIALAILALHEQQIIHRNVSAESVFVDASDGPETMRLGSFEWSVRVGASSHEKPDSVWGIPPEIANGKSGYTFDTDWYAYGMLLARTFLSLENLPAQNAQDLNASVFEEVKHAPKTHLTSKESELIMRLIGNQSQGRLKFGDEVVRLVSELVRDLAMPVAHNMSSLLQLVFHPTNNSLVDALIEFGFEVNPDNPHEPYSDHNKMHVSLLKDFIRNDVKDGLVYGLPKKDRCILVGKQVTLVLRPYRDAEGTESWDFAHVSHATVLPDQNYKPTPIAGFEINVIIPKEVDLARGNNRQSWLRLIPEIDVDSQLTAGLSRFHDFLRCTNQLELLLRDAEIAAYEVVKTLPSDANWDRIVIRERPREKRAEFCTIKGGMIEMLQRELDTKTTKEDHVILSDTDSLLVSGMETRIDPRIDPWVIEAGTLDEKNKTVILKRQIDPKQRALNNKGYIRTYGQYAQVTLIQRRTAAIERLHEHSYLLRALAQPGMVFMDTGPAPLPNPSITSKLDNSKLAVIQDVLRVRPIYSLQGPPGTGKTTLVAHLLRQILKDDPVAQILVTAPGHTAVDGLLEKVRDEVFIDMHNSDEEKPICIRLARERKNDRSTHHEWSAKPVTRKLLTAVGSHLSVVKDRTLLQDEWLNLARRLLTCADSEEDQRTLSGIQELVKRSASITYCTTSAADLEALADGKQSFDWSIVEEAGKSHGFDLALPLQAGHRWLLLGDQNQLAPHQFETYSKGIDQLADAVKALTKLPSKGLVDTEWIKRWNDYTNEQQEEFRTFCKHWLPTFGTLWEQLKDGIHGEERVTVENSIGASVGRLDVQYRMHPTIGNLISDAFYPDFGGIKNATEDEFGNPKPEILHQLTKPLGIAGKAICWIDTPWCQKDPSYGENNPDDGCARYENPKEVAVIAAFLKQTYDANPYEVAILSPYSAQVALIKNNKDISRIKAEKRIRFRQNNRSEDESANQEVRSAHTVDSFQGNESDVVIVSLVRNNTKIPGPGERPIGFLDEPNRLNVLLSRAQKLLILVGSWDFFVYQVSLVDLSDEHNTLWPMKKVIEVIKTGFENGDAVKIDALELLAQEESI